jgi:hypothetical protein
MPSAIRLSPSDFRPLRMRHSEPRSLRVNLPRTRILRLDFRAWRARLRSLDLPFSLRALRALDSRLITAGVVAILGSTFAVLAPAQMPTTTDVPNASPFAAARADPGSESPCARQTWPYLDRRCLADAREAGGPARARLITTDNLASLPNLDAGTAADRRPAAGARQDTAAGGGKNSELAVAPSEPRRTDTAETPQPWRPFVAGAARQQFAGPEPMVEPERFARLPEGSVGGWRARRADRMRPVFPDARAQPSGVQVDMPRPRRWTGLEYDGRGRFYGRRPGTVLRPF